MFQEWYDNRHEYAKNWKERTEGKVVGFILGDASGWEYGVPNTVGWIDTIGVHPDYQKKGNARALLMKMVGRQVPLDPAYKAGSRGTIKNEISFPGSPALWAGSFTICRRWV